MRTKGLVNIDKYQGKQCCKEYQPGDISLFIEVFRDSLIHMLMKLLFPDTPEAGFHR